jgi:hypothetical protein
LASQTARIDSDGNLAAPRSAPHLLPYSVPAVLYPYSERQMQKTAEVSPRTSPSEATPTEAPPLPAVERAGRKLQMFGPDAQLDLEEAAAVLDVSPSTFERIGIPCVPWSARGRRWRYATIVEHGRQLEARWASRWR